MNLRLSEALCRADRTLASALFLGLGTAAACAAYAPAVSVNASAPPTVPAPSPKLDLLLEKAVAYTPAPLPDVSPLPRPKPMLTRLRIDVALANLASETSCLAQALYYEARGEGRTGEKAIAEVVLHRTHKAGYPHTICGVVHQNGGGGCQFSFTCSGIMNRPKAPGAWARAVRLATKILTGALPLTNITNGAIAFHVVGLDANWRGMVPTARIGNHIFYRRAGRASI